MSFIDERIAAAMSCQTWLWCPTWKGGTEGIRRAPDRNSLNIAQTEIALKNALRYIPKKLKLIPKKFLEELFAVGM